MMYRNQTPTLTQISLLAQMRITTTQEAVAYLRAKAILDAQVAEVLQKSSIREQHLLNRVARAQAPEPVPTPEPTPAPAQTFVPEEVSSDEGYTEEDAVKRVAELKKAKKAKKK